MKELETIWRDHETILSNIESVKNYLLEQKAVWMELIEKSEMSNEIEISEDSSVWIKNQEEGSLRKKLENLFKSLTNVTTDVSKRKVCITEKYLLN